MIEEVPPVWTGRKGTGDPQETLQFLDPSGPRLICGIQYRTAICLGLLQRLYQPSGSHLFQADPDRSLTGRTGHRFAESSGRHPCHLLITFCWNRLTGQCPWTPYGLQCLFGQLRSGIRYAAEVLGSWRSALAHAERKSSESLENAKKKTSLTSF